MLGFDPFLLFRVLRHCAWIQSLLFVSGSPASRSDSILSFCFRFSSIVLGFDPFLLFQGLQHRARILSLPFVSGSPKLCPNLIPFFFGFSGIVLGFDPFLLFRVLQHRARIRSLLFVSGSSTSCLDSIPSSCFRLSGIVSRSLIFPGIVLGFLLVLQSWRLSSVSLRYWVRGQNCWSSGFFTIVHFTLASLALRTHDSLVHSLY